MARSSKFFARVSLAFAAVLAGCQKKITPLAPEDFRRCQEAFAARPRIASVRAEARLTVSDRGTELNLKSSLLAAHPDRFYLEADALGFPAFVVAHRDGALTMVAPAKGRAYRKRPAPTLADLLGTPLTWTSWTGVLLSRFDDVRWESFDRDCFPRAGTLPSGERLRLGKPLDRASGVPRAVELSWKGGSARWEYRSYQAGARLQEAWFEPTIPPGTKFVERPDLVR